MNPLLRLLPMLTRNGSLSLVLLAVGWYGGAKYGAPDYVLSTVDDLVARGGNVVGALLGQEPAPAPADDGADTSDG